jgi:hypothetical protein
MSFGVIFTNAAGLSCIRNMNLGMDLLGVAHQATSRIRRIERRGIDIDGL